MIQLPEIPKKATLTVDLHSDMFDMQLIGEFKVHRPTLEETQAISANVSAANNGQQFVLAQYAGYVNAIYELAMVVEKAPEWWDDIVKAQDSAIIMRVYSEYAEWKRAPFRYEKNRQGEVEQKNTEGNS